MKTINWPVLTRKIHYWGSIAIALPVLIVIVTGILLLLRKDIDWIQPPTEKGSSQTPTITFDRILITAKSVPKANIEDWSDIDRLDVRPAKGIIKIRAVNQWEIQIDQQTSEVLSIAYRRSDVIEAIHEGTFFHDAARLGIFLPSALVLFALWISGIYLFCITLAGRVKKKRRLQRRA